jgi:hypothetical protein
MICKWVPELVAEIDAPTRIYDIGPVRHGDRKQTVVPARTA